MQHSTEETKNIIKVGDTIRLKDLNRQIVLIDFFKNKKGQSYESIKTLPILEEHALINTPILFAGFETKIEKIKEVKGVLYGYSHDFEINLNAAFEAQEIEKLNKEDAHSEAKYEEYRLIIEEVRHIHNNYHLGLITEFEKNHHLHDRLSFFYGFLYRQNLILIEEEKQNTMEETFSFSWQSILEQEEFGRDSLGVLHDPDTDLAERIEYRINFLKEAHKRNIHKKSRIGRSMSSLWISRAKTHGKTQHCNGIIMIEFRDKSMAPTKLSLKGNFFMYVEYWKKNKNKEEIITEQPWEDDDFNAMIQDLLNQEIC